MKSTRIGKPRAHLALAVLVGLCCSSMSQAGNVTTDGSVGAHLVLSGPNFNIPASLGTQKGGNLFHSFSTFNLSAGEVASFSGPTNVSNVIARVTGGKSTIDGTLQCSIANANFYLINPSGVVFGPNAALDVKGSFVVTTADYLKLADGKHFNATNLSDTTLTTAAPAAFGFLSAPPQGIELNGAGLAVTDGKTISLVGGDITITNGVLNAPGGRVNLVSNASKVELAFDATDSKSTIDLSPAPAAMGTISLTASFVQADGPAGGKVSIRGGDLTMSQSTISAVTTNNQTGVGIDVILSGTLSILDSEIFTDTAASGKSGPINVTAGLILIDSQGDTSFPTGISAQGNTGAGGNISLQADTLSVVNGGIVSSATTGTGAAGNVTVSAGAITLDGQTSPLLTGLFTSSQSPAKNGGAAGTLTVSGNSLTMSNGAQFSADTLGGAAAGTASVNVAQISIDGGGVDRYFDPTNVSGTGIFARSLSLTQNGAGGTVNVNAATSLNIVNGGAISTESDNDGQAGRINITGGAVTIDDQNKGIFTGLFADESAGLTGASTAQINFNVDSVTLTNGGFISASAFGLTDAGAISITTQHGLTLSADPAGMNTLISVATFGPGNGGSIAIHSDTVNIGANCIIGAGTSSSGAGGTIQVNANTLAIDTGTIFSTSVGDPTLLPAGAVAGNAGNITVNVSNLNLTNGGALKASTSGEGHGGTITVTANAIVADGSIDDQASGIFVDTTPFANNTTSLGAAGTIVINANSMALTNGASISAGTAGQGAGGSISVAVTGPLNIDGGTNNLLTGILSKAQQEGFAGSVNVQADAITIANQGAISSSAGGSGSAGDVHVTANSISITTGGIISSDTAGSGAGGNVGVQVAGTLSIDGTNAEVLTGISAGTKSTGVGGNVTVAADTILLNEASSNVFTGISVLSQSTGQGGRGGDINVTANTLLHISNGARISTETSGLGDGGNITVSAGKILIENPGDQTGAGIVADSDSDGAGGHAGNINISAKSLTLQSTGEISSSTFGQGDGGNIVINASKIVADADGSDPATLANFGETITGISASSQNSGAGGKAGDISITADSIQVLHGAQINSATFGMGAGGSIDVKTGSLLISGLSSFNHQVDSTLGSASQGIGIGGDAGNVTITAGAVGIFDEGEINNQTTNSGKGGSIFLSAQNLFIDFGSGLVTSSTSTGTAGAIKVHLSDSLKLTRQSTIDTAATSSSGGGITIFVGRSISLSGGSSITAQSGGEGGTIDIICPGTIDLLRSQILTEAGNNGGDIKIDPSFVILQSSQLSANGGNNGGNITVRPDFLLESQSSITATGARGVSGSLQITPDYNLTGALLSLPASLSDAITLQPTCAADLGSNVSSFIVTGRGAAPLQPGGWIPDLPIRVPDVKRTDGK